MGSVNYPKILETLSAMKCSGHGVAATVRLKNENSVVCESVCCQHFSNVINEEFTNQLELQLFG
jgi:hypothetical protein